MRNYPILGDKTYGNFTLNALVKKGGIIRVGDEVKVCIEKTTEDFSTQAKLL